MSDILYEIGEPTAKTTGADWYVDLETDTMYELQDGEWVAMFQHGKPADEHGNIIDEYLYGY